MTLEQQLNNEHPKFNLRLGRPLLKLVTYKSIELAPKKEPQSCCSEETNTRLDFLQEQLNTLISQTAKHTKDSFSNQVLLKIAIP